MDQQTADKRGRGHAHDVLKVTILDAVVELLSTDAVQVAVGDPVIIADWGGPKELAGKVTRVDPFGITQFSALGVEEQRMNAVIAFTSPPEDYVGLSHGFRVESRIIVWQSDDTLPNSPNHNR